MSTVKLPSDFSTLSKVTDYIRKNPELLTQEVNKYTAEKLMMLLDNDRLAALEDEFNEHPEGIELPSFIWLMECAISHSPEEKYDLIMGLIKLFNDIDINGDQHMEWSEFTQFIIDAVIGDGDKISEKRGDGKGNEAQQQKGESEIVDSVYSQKSLNYMPSRTSNDLVVHAQPIKKIKNIAANDTIAVLEESSMIVQIYDNKGELKIKLSAFKNNPLTQKNFVLDLAVSARLNLVLSFFLYLI